MLFRDRFHLGRRARMSLAGFVTALVILFALFETFGLRPFFQLERISIAAGTSVAQFFTNLRTYGDIADALARAEAERDRLAKRAGSEEMLKRENEELRQLLTFSKQRPEIERILAHVIARTIDPSRSELLIDAGFEDGVRISSAVLADQGTLIGKVASVNARTAVIRLLTDPRTRVGARTDGTDMIGISEGTSGVLLSLRFIPQDTTLAVHDLVFTSGLDAAVPANLEIGYITDIESDPNAPFQSASIEPRLDARLVSIVAIVRPPL